MLPPLLCSAAAASEAHAARAIPGRPGSEPHLAHLDDSLRATYALVWAAGAVCCDAPLAVLMMRLCCRLQWQ